MILSGELKEKTIKLRSSKKLLQLNLSIITIMAAFIMLIIFMIENFQNLPLMISILIGFLLLAILLIIQLKIIERK